MGMLGYWVKKITPRQYAAFVRSTLAGLVSALEKHLSETSRLLEFRSSSIDSLVREHDAISRAFTARWGFAPPPASNHPRTTVPADLAQRLVTARMPLFEGGKVSKRQKESRQVSQRFCEIDTALMLELSELAQGWKKVLPFDGTSSAKFPPLLPGLVDSPARLAEVAPGEGPLVLQVGEMAWALHAQVPSFRGGRPTAMSSELVSALSTQVTFPALIDLVRDGGFVTSHRRTIVSAVVRLLSLLPAGQLKVHLFDPVRLGASLKVLSDLADTTRAAITDNRVGVVAADLEPMLDDLLRHVATVTQQYLGSRHSTLESYNRSAGEVAEAYQLLVVMDYPTGIQDPNGSVDARVLGKLETLIKAGPRCGVFVLVLASHHQQSSFSSRYADVAPPAPAGLPTLWDGHLTWPSQLPSLVEAALPQVGALSGDPPMGEAAVAAIRSKDWRRYVALKPAVAWTPRTWTAGAAPEVRQLVSRLDAEVNSAKPTSVAPSKTAQRVRVHAGQKFAAQPDDPSTWWKRSATLGLVATIGVTGDRGVGTIKLEAKSVETSVLIGGQPGSGKSVLLHALIGDLVRNYSPDELSLYLLDPKEGVEFTAYARGRLPHARVVTVGAPPESTIDILSHLRKEITRRGALFNRTRSPTSTPVDKLDAYLSVPGVKLLPRIVVVIDEFQALLNGVDDDTAMKVSSLLSELIRLGRSFGIHMVLATQSLQGIRYLPSEVGMIPSRVALRMSDDDSRLFLGANCLDASRLAGAGGQAVLQRPGVENRVVQVTNESKDSVARTVRQLVARANSKATPVVLDFTRPPRPSSLSARAIKDADGNRELRLLVFRGLGVQEPVVARLPAESDGHILAALSDAASSFSVLSTMMATCAINGIPFDVVDFSELQSDFERRLAEISTAGGGNTRRFARPNLLDLYLDESLALARAAGAPATQRVQRILFLANAHKSRMLMKQETSYDKLVELLESGGPARVHVVLHAGGGPAATKLVRHDLWDKFGLRITGRSDSDSSFTILGTNEAERLAPQQLLIWHPVDGTTKGVPFAPFSAAMWSKF